MKEPREIDPQIRGLIEEITSNPRSAVRLVPRKALFPWLASGESLRPGDATRDKAISHLLEVHREELAEILCDAARIAYWKAPVLSHLPRELNGELAMPQEERWRERASREIEANPGGDVGLLRLCLEGVRPEHGHRLALASMSLVPRDETRLCLASTLKVSQPRRSLSIFERVASSSRTSLRFWAGSAAAGRLAFLGQLEEARRAYRDTASFWPTDWVYVFNLSCALGGAREALEASVELGRLPPGSEPVLEEAVVFISDWARRNPQLKSAARQTARHIEARLSNRAREVLHAYQ